jgi:Leucine-rich repeat (LRR) protein
MICRVSTVTLISSRVSPCVENLIIHNNFMSGEIPDAFGKMSQLDYVDLANNRFTGTIPASIFDAASLRLLYLSNNTLSGTIPVTYSKPVSLRDLYLDGNGLTGTIPDADVGKLRNLTEFLVQFNFLSGSMPASVCDLRESSNLEQLFSDCGGDNPELECEFPSCCSRCFEGGGLARRRLTRLQKGQ